MRGIFLSIGIAIAAAMPLSAKSATFIGDTANFVITAGTSGNELTNVNSVVTDPGVEASFSTDTIDVAASTIEIIYDLTGFLGVGDDLRWDIFGLDTDDGSTISSLTLLSGNAADVLATSFTGNSISITIANLFNPPQAIHKFKFEVGTTTAVPLPATLPLLVVALGLFGFGFARRRA